MSFQTTEGRRGGARRAVRRGPLTAMRKYLPILLLAASLCAVPVGAGNSPYPSRLQGTLHYEVTFDGTQVQNEISDTRRGTHRLTASKLLLRSTSASGPIRFYRAKSGSWASQNTNFQLLSPIEEDGCQTQIENSEEGRGSFRSARARLQVRYDPDERTATLTYRVPVSYRSVLTIRCSDGSEQRKVTLGHGWATGEVEGTVDFLGQSVVLDFTTNQTVPVQGMDWVKATFHCTGVLSGKG